MGETTSRVNRRDIAFSEGESYRFCLASSAELTRIMQIGLGPKRKQVRIELVAVNPHVVDLNF